MTELLLKILLSPENILGMVINLLSIVAMCVIFSEVGEKWWKTLIPIYSTYILYKNFWKHKWFCVVEFALLLINSRCASIIRKNILTDMFDFIVALIQNRAIDVDVDIQLLVICIVGSMFTSTALFEMKCASYYKIGKKLNYNALKIFLGILFPVFFLGFILYDRWKRKNIDR